MAAESEARTETGNRDEPREPGAGNYYPIFTDYSSPWASLDFLLFAFCFLILFFANMSSSCSLVPAVRKKQN